MFTSNAERQATRPVLTQLPLLISSKSIVEAVEAEGETLTSVYHKLFWEVEDSDGRENTPSRGSNSLGMCRTS